MSFPPSAIFVLAREAERERESVRTNFWHPIVSQAKVARVPTTLAVLVWPAFPPFPLSHTNLATPDAPMEALTKERSLLNVRLRQACPLEF